MPMYQIDYAVTLEDTVTLDADDTEHAETLAREYVSEMYATAVNTAIDEVKEIKLNG